jgi:uncharacterized protein YcaQ
MLSRLRDGFFEQQLHQLVSVAELWIRYPLVAPGMWDTSFAPLEYPAMEMTRHPTRVILDIREARRLALSAAGLLKSPDSTLPARAAGSGLRARRACHAVLDRFGYLQLDSIAVAGARTQGIVCAARIDGLDTSMVETLLKPGEPVFEYWGHEASWLPLSLYSTFDFRRREYRIHPWWGDFVNQHRRLADWLVDYIADQGPVRSLDLGPDSLPGWANDNVAQLPEAIWSNKHATRLLEALWSDGTLAVRERRSFQRTFDLSERVIPQALREREVPEDEAIATLLLKALDGHGFATTGTLAATWRLRNRREQIARVLDELCESGEILPAAVETRKRTISGWLRPVDAERVDALNSLRPRRDRGVLLSPFDPLLWDRTRTAWLFDFDLVVEIYKPATQRQFGYYCLPVLAGDRLIGRVDLKADRRAGTLNVLSRHFETSPTPARDETAMDSAISRFATHVNL